MSGEAAETSNVSLNEQFKQLEPEVQSEKVSAIVLTVEEDTDMRDSVMSMISAKFAPEVEVVLKDYTKLHEINAAITDLLQGMSEEKKQKIDMDALEAAQKVGSESSEGKTDAVILQAGFFRANAKEDKAFVILVAHRTVLVKEIGDEEAIPELGDVVTHAETGDFYYELVSDCGDWSKEGEEA